MRPKILFIKWRSFSHINDSIRKLLENKFEKNDVEVLDVDNFWKNKTLGLYWHYCINIWHFVNEYGNDFIAGHKKVSSQNLSIWFKSTSYMSSLINRYIQKQQKKEKYLFTFQTQSLFNGKVAGIPHFIYTDHTSQSNLLYPDINPREYIRSTKFIKKIEQKIYADADMIFTMGSQTTYSLLNQYLIPEKKVLTVYAGSNTPDLYLENYAKYASKNILFIGIEWERKGGSVLLKVFEKVLQKFNDASLTIVGCSPANIKLPNCNVVGKVKADELPRYYNNAAIFCLPTLREPFGIVFVEAMNYKLPIVANNIGCIPDMVIDDYNGYTCKNNVEEYADRICKIIGNPEQCRQMGQNSYNQVETKFSWEFAGKAIKKSNRPVSINTRTG